MSIPTALPSTDTTCLLPETKHPLFEKVIEKLKEKECYFSSKIQNIYYEMSLDMAYLLHTPASRTAFIEQDQFIAVFSKLDHLFLILENKEISAEDEKKHIRDALKSITRTKSKSKKAAIPENDVTLFQAQLPMSDTILAQKLYHQMYLDQCHFLIHKEGKGRHVPIDK